jgi:putative ABC transport system permease protein
MISRESERRYWNGQDPIGQRVKFVSGTTLEWIRIVGVVSDFASTDRDELPEPAIYLPFAQNATANTAVLVRTSGDPLSLAGPVRSEVWAIDPDQPIDDVKTMEQAIHDLLVTDHALITLFVTFALFALVMASVGIYGVMSYAVSQRTSEISIRMALGAKTSDVRMMVLGQGGKLIIIGSVVGLIGALGISRLLTNMVVGINAVDSVTFIGVPAVLIGVGLIANYLPARRATRIDPMTALRVE